MQTLTTNSQKQYNSIDLCKFIFSFAVIAIHTEPFIGLSHNMLTTVCKCFFEMAVPFYFLASGYLLAKKSGHTYSSENHLPLLKKQLFSMVRMYLIWTLIYSPLAVYHYISTETPVIRAVLLYIRGLFFIGEHYNSWPLWYLLSTIYALIVIGFFIRKKCTPKILLTISITASIVSVGFTALADYTGDLPSAADILRKLIIYSISNGRVFKGMIYIPIGMLLARKQLPKAVSLLVLLGGFSADCFIANPVLSAYLRLITSVAFFGVIAAAELKNRPVYPKLRAMSTVIYLTHMYVWSFYYTIVYGEKTFGADAFIATSVMTAAAAGIYLTVKGEKTDQRGSSGNLPPNRKVRKCMEFVIEFILELIFDFGIEASKSSKVPKFIRVLLIAVISLLFTAVIGLIFFMGVSIFETNPAGGIVVILFGIVMLILSVAKFRKTYLKKRNRK